MLASSMLMLAQGKRRRLATPMALLIAARFDDAARASPDWLAFSRLINLLINVLSL